LPSQRAQRAQGRNAFGLDPADIPQTNGQGSRFSLLESQFVALARGIQLGSKQTPADPPLD
jgi:hypothetical protein